MKPRTVLNHLLLLLLVGVMAFGLIACQITPAPQPTTAPQTTEATATKTPTEAPTETPAATPPETPGETSGETVAPTQGVAETGAPAAETATPAQTPKPTATPQVTATPKPTATRQPGDSSLGAAYANLDRNLALEICYDRQDDRSADCSIFLKAQSGFSLSNVDLYYGNADGLLPGFGALANCKVSKTGEFVQALRLASFQSAPKGATTLLAVNRKQEILAYAMIPAQKQEENRNPIYSYAVISDIHVFEDEPYGTTYVSINGTDDLPRALQVIAGTDAAFIGITGDLIISFSDDHNIINAELKKSTDILKTATVPVYVVKGNHDKRVQEDVWKEYTGCDLDYSFEMNGDRHIFLSLKTVQNVGSVDAAPYGTQKVKWLKSELEKAKGQRVFLYMHYPFNGMSGLTPGWAYGFASGSSEEQTILNLIREHGNVVVYHGHSHYDFKSVLTYPGIAVNAMDDGSSYSVHIPSVAYPRDTSGGYATQESEGYLVEVYEDSILLRGIDFVTGLFAPIANCRLDTRVRQNSLQETAITLNAGESRKITVNGTYQSATWTSSDPSIATVKNGTVTGVHSGTATISAQIDGFVYSCTVTVSLPGTGTQADPYRINSAVDFVTLQDAIASGQTYSGARFVLTADIHLNDSEFYEPMSDNRGGDFAGFLDGCGHVISAEMEARSEDFAVPFFWNLSGTVVNTGFRVATQGCAKTSYAIARQMNNGTIVNCFVEGSMVANNSYTSVVAGTSSNAKLNNLFVNVTITGTEPSNSSSSGVTLKGSNAVKNIYYIPNGCYANYGETAVSAEDAVQTVASLNDSLSAAATAAGVQADALCRWEVDANGAPALVKK